ncbi:MAG: Vitamin B12 transporter BtuB [Steroidobacteraceae bacterium]|nr:Vitamin B12 transporter BtuB [Steroidobacteraceae bacterium]
MDSRDLLFRVAATGIAVCASTSLLAQEQPVLQEVTVTAQKQEENLQDVPIAITALSGEELENRGITSFAGVAQSTPSISFSPFPAASDTLILYMRGQGEADPGQVNSNPAVGLYEDGFLIARPNVSTFDLADIERVEVLRGPQGTLYGRNTTGGAVNLITRKPSGEFGLRESLDFGNRNLFRSLTTVDLPAWHGLAAKVSFLASSVDGYVKNAGSSHDYGEQAQRAGRLQLRWDLAPSLQADYFFELGTLDSTPIYYHNASLAGLDINGFIYPAVPREAPETTYRPIDLPLSEARYDAHGLTLSWSPSEALTIKSLTGYRTIDSHFFQNYAEAFTFAPQMPFGLNTEDRLKAHQFSQEVQFVGKASGLGLQYVAGLYYFKEGGSGYRNSVFPDFFLERTSLLDADTESRAVYGQLTWTPQVLQQKLDLTVGARYTKEDRTGERFQSVSGFVVEDGAATGAIADLSFSRFNPSFTAQYHWTDDVDTYAKVATGFRAGGVYAGAGIGAFDQAIFGPEKLTSYELGLKSYLFYRRVRLNAAAFYAKYDDMQVNITVDPVSFASAVFNAGKATIGGAELELLVAPVEDLTLSLNYAWLDTKIDRIDAVPGSLFDATVNPGSPYQPGDNIADVFVIPHAPRSSFDVRADYTLLRRDAGTLEATVGYRWQDKVFQDSGGGRAIPGRDFNSQPSYGLLDARLTFSRDLQHDQRLRVSLWGKNVLDEKYPVHVIPSGDGPVPEGGAIAGFYGQAIAWAEPATYGINLSFEY